MPMWNFLCRLLEGLQSLVEKSRLYQELGNKYNEIKTLDSLTEKINAGLTLEEVLNHVFDSFRTIIPYDRIGVAFLVDDGKTVEHKWTRTDAKEIKLENGYSVKLEETSLSILLLNSWQISYYPKPERVLKSASHNLSLLNSW